MGGYTAYCGRIINPKTQTSFEEIKRGALVVDKRGRIVDHGELDELRGRYTLESVDFGEKILMPGFIDTHTHLPQYDSAATEEGEGMLSWLRECIYPAEKAFSEEPRARELSRRFFYDARANGTTTACVYLTTDKVASEVAFQEAERAGLRVVMGKLMMDSGEPEIVEDASSSVSESEELCKRWHHKDRGRIMYSFIPRSASCCTLELMKSVGTVSREKRAFIQTHLAESQEELSWVREEHPEFKDDTDVYYKAGLLGPRTIVAHAIYLGLKELQILRKKGVGIAHCPSSNLFLKNGIMDVHERLAYGLKVGLGSDVAGGPDLSMLKVMALACYSSKANYCMSALYSRGFEGLKREFARLGSEGKRLYSKVTKVLKLSKKVKVVDSVLAFYLATLGGAEALGLEDRIGSFGRGKEADFIVVDPLSFETRGGGEETIHDGHRLLSKLVYRGDGRAIVKTYVRGVEVFGKI